MNRLFCPLIEPLTRWSCISTLVTMIRLVIIAGLALLIPAGCASVPCANYLYGLSRCEPPAPPASKAAGSPEKTLGSPAPPVTLVEKKPGAPAGTKYKTRRNDPPARLDMAKAGRQLNAYRVRYGLKPLAPNIVLHGVARSHARDLARRDRVSHTGSDDSDPSIRATRAGYRWSVFGENISAGRMTFSEVLQAWHDSPAHRRNLQLAGATEFGLAVIHEPDSTYSNTWVLVVGAPAKKSPLIMRIGN